MVRFCQPLNRMPTPARVVLALGVALLMLALVNARLADIVTPELQRAEVLSGMAAVGLMLVAVLWTRADPSQAPRRDLKGEQGLVLDPDIDAATRDELGWGSHMLLTATPAATVLVYWDEAVLLRRGLVRDAVFLPGAICQRAMERETTISLVNTTLFPGRHEFDPLVENLPAVLICPVGNRGVVVLGDGPNAVSADRTSSGWKVGLLASEPHWRRRGLDAWIDGCRSKVEFRADSAFETASIAFRDDLIAAPVPSTSLSFELLTGLFQATG